jgi:carboxyl-terminal processing protease
MKRIVLSLLCLIAGLQATRCGAVESGMWWNPAESGRGFTIEVTNSVMVFAAYVYTDSGASQWLLSSGPMTDASTYSGTMQTYRGGQTLSGAYRSAQIASADAGTLKITFADATHATLVWPGGTVPIQKMRFAVGSAPGFKPVPGWWWNPAESGRGFGIEVQGGVLVMTGYMYDDSGAPVWYLSSGALAEPTHYHSQWLAYRGGQTINGTYHPPATPQSAGDVDLRFTGATTAVLTLPDGRTIPLSRFPIGAAPNYAASASLAKRCVAPRPATMLSAITHKPYGDTQGTLLDENAFIQSWVNETYLWYRDVPLVDPTDYVIGATVPYVNPSSNAVGSTRIQTNADAVDAYFNSQRSTEFTLGGKPKDPFHFTYPTAQWETLTLGTAHEGFGFVAALLSRSPPRKVVVAYTQPNSPAADNGLMRGTEFLNINGVDVINGGDVDTLNEAFFAPVGGKAYVFTVRDAGAAAPRTVTLTPFAVIDHPVQNVQTLSAPNDAVGYLVFNEHSATAEAELVAAVNQLKAARSGAGIQDLVLDLRYNGGGLLAIASELAYMIAGPNATRTRTFERESFNDKQTALQQATPFYASSLGFSLTSGRPLPHLDLPRVYVLTSAGTCSASEAVMNGLRGVGIEVIQVGATTCGKPYGFFPQENCSTTFFTIQFEGVNDAGFGDYADGFVPAGTLGRPNDLPGCVAADDFAHALGDPSEGLLAAALGFRSSGSCPAAKALARDAQPQLLRSPAHEIAILRAPPAK